MDNSDTNINTKLQAAHEMIKEEKFDVARSILMTITDNETANQWLKRLDEIAPSNSNNQEVELVNQLKKLVQTLNIPTKWEYCEVHCGFETKKQEGEEDFSDYNQDILTGKLYVFVDYLFSNIIETQTFEMVDQSIYAMQKGKAFVSARRFARRIVAKLGLEGWEVIHIHHDQSPKADPFKWYLKRSIKKS